MKALLGPLAGELAFAPAVVKGAVDRVPVHSSAKGQNVACLGSNQDVVQVDRALDATGLIGSLEMAGQRAAVLFDLKPLR